jgi:ubiquinone/menaquinone biosynthesis C-methylase UbiE
MLESNKISQIYNTKAEEYDMYCEMHDTAYGYIEKLRRECVFSLITGRGRLLDTGCGTGFYLEKLSENECFGIDISQKMLNQCKRKHLENVFLGDSVHLMFKNSTFDIILCVNSFQYFPEPIKSLTEMNRVLKESGEVILTSGNWITPRIIAHKLFKVFQRQKSLERRYTIFTLKKRFSKAGFEISDIVGFNFLPYKTNLKKRNEKVLKMFEYIERKIGRTPIKYFANEYAIRLVKQRRDT